ncbi:MAG TPA: hypothetical protein VK034_18965 [Enhygromyxa sp.]|nr:hypothetical protein [Enhygromyxa sp.]
MQLEPPVTISPTLATLAATEAEEPAQEQSAVTECPHAKQAEQPKPKQPLRVMFWHLDELGGGFHRSTDRPDWAIAAYAELIRVLKPDIVVLAGLQRTRGAVPVPVDAKVPHLVMEETAVDSGVTEAKRILARLQSLDGGAGWTARFVTASDGSHVYQFDSTTCVLHRTDGGITFKRVEVVDSAFTPKLGLTGKLAQAIFDAPKQRDEPVHVVAPLGVIDERRLVRDGPPARDPDTEPEATGELADTSIFALSAPGDLRAGGAFGGFRAQVDALYRLPSSEGSVLRDDHWKTVGEQHGALLANYAAVGLDDLLLQDEHMHWEALTPPSHARKLDEVRGRLADAVLICHGRTTGKPDIEELRVVDLVRAALTAKLLAEADADQQSSTDDSLPSEDGALADQQQAFRADRQAPKPADDLANALAACRYFSHALSGHWPVITQIRWS